MQELAGRLTELDPAAGESVRVIDYFDSLVAGGAGIESIVRAAAILSATSATALVRGRLIGIDADGARMTPAAPIDTTPTDAPIVWLHRDGGPGPNDAMIIDRAQIALSIILARTDPAMSAVERLVDAGTSRVDREAAAQRLRLTGPIRLVAAPPHSSHPVAASTVLATREGAVWIGVGDVIPAEGPVGTSVAHDIDDLPRACDDARLALRLATEDHRVVDAAELGVLILLARTFDPSATPHPDVDALEGLDERTRAVLDVVVESESIRAAAVKLSLHHSSLQARHEGWTRQLGYDPLSPRGRVRFLAARLMQRLA
ncbi:hypothetical protein GCM10010988_21700 [Cnuibacter physcomitrellae]|uniref:Uncharacterized protein n=1 Tax=Cnuibacter physcomitrellae TaxID=1619308 RepID=A0A1X9LNU0_9MICO|nr:hypothetical protein [Cnuibacter physcomitrellae]ARJ06843.1 hypothetical protein B5808_17655 [Cnuibacter physcomitrellae]GGI38964.1 hypothetical protein GCM10010988_21700 [Cnuibacter physcomitrellae]